ncbi:hypothetical protein ACTD5D_20815 [Nocardia takedensis]|uniref:hypothetical protein n=1 Tax=Nocardia takedensis TaxID=259390 RepID=UPI003F77669B
MDNPNGIFAFVSSAAETNRSGAEPATGTLIGPRIAVFLHLSRELVDQISAGEVLLVSASGDVADAVAIERISVLAHPDHDRCTAVARLTRQPNTVAGRPVSGAALRDALVDNDGDLDAALTQLADLHDTDFDSEPVEFDDLVGLDRDDDVAEQDEIGVNESRYLLFHQDRRAFGDSICRWLRIC